MKWQPIDTMPEDIEDAVIFGMGHGYGDSDQKIAKNEPRIWLLSYWYMENGVGVYASTETYYGSETWYVKATHWAPLPPTTELDA